LLELNVKELRLRFIALTNVNRELGSKEKAEIIKEGIEIGLSEAQITKIIDLWLEAESVKAVEAWPTTDSSSAYVPHDELLDHTYCELSGIPDDADSSEIKKAYEQEYSQHITSEDEARWARISAGCEILENSDEKEACDKKIIKPEPEVEYGVPVLKVICKMDGYYLYKDVKKGTQFTETIVIKNDHSGQLKGKITSDAEWLVPERGNLNYYPEQTLGISILTSKIPANTYDAKGTVTLDTNGGPPYLISFRVILNDIEIAADRFRKTYVPLAAACAGLIGSFGSSPFSYFVFGALLAGIIFYSIATFTVKAALQNGLDIFKPPSYLMQGAAGAVVILTLLSHSIGSSVEQEKLDMSFRSEKLDTPAMPQPEQLQALPEAENRQVMLDQIDHYQQFSQTDGILTKAATPLSGSLTSMASTTVGADRFWGFGLESLSDKAHYGFGCSNRNKLNFRMASHCADWTAIRTYQNPIALYFYSQDWGFVQKIPKDSRCDGSTCPHAAAVKADANPKNILSQPPLTKVLKSPSVNAGYVKASRSNTRLASNKAKSKKRKPKASSFAPPSRDDL
jgi:hypothetical protein